MSQICTTADGPPENWQPAFLLFLVLLAPVLIGCVSQTSKNSQREPAFEAATVPDDDALWKTLDFKALSFRVPPDMMNIPVQGVDSLVGRCASSKIVLTFDYGMYSGGSFKRIARRPEFAQLHKNVSIIDTRIDGRGAELVSYSVETTPDSKDHKTNIIRVQVPGRRRGSSSYSHDNLSMTAYCQSKTNYPTARRIFESIRFARE